MTEVLISALMLGLMGSFHCVGMCGPIAIALPLKNDSWFSRIFGGVLYNLGRAITYALMGLVFGLVGQGLKLGGFQQWVSIIMGAVMVLSVFFPWLFRGRVNFDKIVGKYVSGLKTRFGYLFSARSYQSLLIIGLLNGLLPCGLVYMAIAGAIATANVVHGILFMFVFGLGTLPLLLLVSLAGNVISTGLRNKVRKIIPVVIVIIGLLFILRGLNLGIPFISPPDKKLEIKTHSGGAGTEKPCCMRTDVHSFYE
jgi:sulfite exporter TauE/SafE